MHPLEAIRDFVRSRRIEPARLLVAVSGGVDSTALLLAMAELRDSGYSITAGHINHRLRGGDSEQDEEFIRSLCSDLGISLEVADGTLPPERVRARGIEAAARALRYERLEEMRARTGARLIATGHQKNDQAETVLLRLITASGPARLRGILPVTRNHVIRPLLEVTREEIEAFLAERGVTARSDRSNRDRRFLRNRIRWEVLPLLEGINPNIVETLAETARQAREELALLAGLIEETGGSAIRRGVDRTEIDLASVPGDGWLLRSLLAREIRRLEPDARDVSAADLRRLEESISQLARTRITRELELIREEDRLIVRRIPHATPPFEIPLTSDTPADVREIGARVTMRRVDHVLPPLIDSDPLHQYVQFGPDQLHGDSPPPLTVRNRRRGDRFQPLGMTEEKKLNEFLIDRKISRELRDSIALIVWNARIVWVAGVEVSESFKVREPSRPAWELRIEYRDEA